MTEQTGEDEVPSTSASEATNLVPEREPFLWKRFIGKTIVLGFVTLSVAITFSLIALPQTRVPIKETLLGWAKSEYCIDQDQDGYCGMTIVRTYFAPDGYIDTGGPIDCDDNNPAAAPGRPELCATHFDDNCNGQINEGAAQDAMMFFEDRDGDGEGDPSVTQHSCAALVWFVWNATDCDDTNPLLNTSDADGDGVTSCNGDPNDHDPSVRITPETCCPAGDRFPGCGSQVPWCVETNRFKLMIKVGPPVVPRWHLKTNWRSF